MPLYGHVYLISICKLDVICINSESRHVIITVWRSCVFQENVSIVCEYLAYSNAIQMANYKCKFMHDPQG